MDDISLPDLQVAPPGGRTRASAAPANDRKKSKRKNNTAAGLTVERPSHTGSSGSGDGPDGRGLSQSGPPATHWLLVTLERLLAISAVDLRSALGEASDLVANAISADKVDIFLFDPSITSLVAMGVSHTSLSRRQLELGLDRLPLANGGATVSVFTREQPHITGRADLDPNELAGIKDGLGVRSVVGVPLYVAGELRGAVQADSQQPDAFSEYDLRFMEAVAGWIGTITHRAELIEQIRRDAHEEAKRRAAEELVTIIAHDLGNYLTPLKARVGLLRLNATRDGHEKYVRDANEMNAVLDRLEKMVRDLLDVGKLEQGIFQLSRQNIDLVALAEETARALSAPASPVNVQSYGEVRAEVDPDRLRQALENLLANAVRHSPDGATVDVIVMAEKRDDGEWAMLSVKDQGPGISPEIMPKLFSRFAPGPDSSGLGIGLYLAQSITRAHGGTVTAESEPGTGATFTMSLPLGDGSLPEESA